MLNPLQVERRFHRVSLAHVSPTSTLHRLREVAEFLDFLGEDAAAFESYVLECGQYVPPLIEALQPDGVSPVKLRKILDSLANADLLVPALKMIEGYGSAILLLRVRIALIYAYVSDIETACAILDPDIGKNVPAWLADFSTSTELTGRQFLHAAIQESLKNGCLDLSAGLQRVAAMWSVRAASLRDATLVPVVEKLRGDRPASSAGSLRSVRLRMFGYADRDELISDAGVFGATRLAPEQTPLPVKAARKLLTETHPFLPDRHCSGRLEFGERHLLHEGRSANLAIALLFYAGVLRSVGQRTEYSIRSTVTLTGDIDASGNVLPVDPAGLAAKTHAVFFSHLDTFVVPAEQLADVRKCLRGLERIHPKRRLVLIGASSIADVVHDCRIVAQERRSLPGHLLQIVRRRRHTLIHAVLLVALGITGWRAFVGPVDRSPVSAVYSGQTMVVRNAHDQMLGEFHVGRATAAALSDPTADHPGCSRIAFADVDGDGINEIVYAQKEDENVCGNRIVCVKAGRAEPLWSLALDHRVDFPDNPQCLDQEFEATCLTVGQFCGGRSLQVLALLRNASFVSLLIEIDGATGRNLGTYLHTGALSPSIVVAELGATQQKAIVVGGINSAFNAPCLAILDPCSIEGCSPSVGRFVPGGKRRGTELQYIRLPESIIGAVLADNAPSMVTDVRAVDSDSAVAIIVNETPGRRGADGQPISAEVYYRIGTGFAVECVGVSSAYEQYFGQIARTLKTLQEPTREYLAFLTQHVRRWDNGRWRGAATIDDAKGRLLAMRSHRTDPKATPSSP